MEKTKYILIVDNQYEYDILVSESKKGVLYELITSDNEVWTSHNRGKIVATLLDTGNGVKISNAKKTMDYSDLSELRILVNFMEAIYKNRVGRESKTYVYVEGSNVTSTPIVL